MITATQIYNYSHCRHRVSLDKFADVLLRDDADPFLSLLFEHGVRHEQAIVASIPVTAKLRGLPLEDLETATLSAMQRREPLIYGGRLTHGDMVAEPDLLKLRGDAYIPGDIKSGRAFEGEHSDGKLKKDYAFQLAHCVNILECIGFGDGTRDGFIIGRDGSTTEYRLRETHSVLNSISWFESYLDALSGVRAILHGHKTTRSMLCSSCKTCPWATNCRNELIAKDDLSLIAELGSASRDALMREFPTVAAFSAADPKAYITKGKKTEFPGIGADSLHKFHARAKLLTTQGAAPYIKREFTLPVGKNEVFFDIEADPLRDVVYLHGFVERTQGEATTHFKPQFAEDVTPAEEAKAFGRAWVYLTDRVKDSTVYYYSKYERTAYIKLARKYPEVCSSDDVEALFKLPEMVDLYTDVVMRCTEWPLYDRSIKTLAQYLGFNWRDTHPSGAASIGWYHQWVETGDVAIRQRILDYNEDDCLATGVVLDGVRTLQATAAQEKAVA